MTQSVLAEQLLNGLAIGLTYALVALGYNLTFGVLKVANLAYGDILTVGALTGLYAFEGLGLHPLLAAGVAIAASVVVGLGVHLLAVVPLGEVEQPGSRRHVAVLISTLGASLVIQHASLESFGPYPHRFDFLFRFETYDFFGFSISSTVIVNLVASALVLLALVFVVYCTRFGLRVRALSANRQLGYASGIDVSRDSLLCVSLSSGLAGVAGILVCQQIGAVSPFTGFPYGLKGLVALIVGRSMSGTAAVAIALGIMEALVVGYISSTYRDFVVYTALVCFVLVRAPRQVAEAA